ncbi:hypothetical protein IB237_20980 [Agrobacterium sp. AGB01]|uniref:hypothetical protein n=1 Tax=Agrobacterium sp. AGB01 TaxID=2769302 RepID=UPI00177EF3D8|nr:hypothetical protein [Agrobacterium sp. AGB01]MBD9389673.1 hypothetical protein [Agrobacterium sp. AGB01]
MPLQFGTSWHGGGSVYSSPNYPTLSCFENFDEKKLTSGWLRWKTSAERSKKKRIQPDKQGDHIPTFYLKISDGLEVQTPIDVPNAHEALNAALNALSQFACSHFPPPEQIVITVMDAEKALIARMSFSFKIEYAPGLGV